MNRTDTLLWLLLIGLTLFAYFSAESNLSNSTLVLFLVGATSIKFLGVGFQFMEMKKAHLFWKLAFVAMLLAYAIVVL